MRRPPWPIASKGTVSDERMANSKCTVTVSASSWILSMITGLGCLLPRRWSAAAAPGSTHAASIGYTLRVLGTGRFSLKRSVFEDGKVGGEDRQRWIGGCRLPPTLRA